MYGTALDKIEGENKAEAGFSKSLASGTIGYFIVKPTDANPSVAISVEAIPVIGSTFIFIIIAYAIFGFILIFFLCAICFSRSFTVSRLEPIFEKIENLEYRKVPLDDIKEAQAEERVPSFPDKNDATQDDPQGPLMGAKEREPLVPQKKSQIAPFDPSSDPPNTLAQRVGSGVLSNRQVNKKMREMKILHEQQQIELK